MLKYMITNYLILYEKDLIALRRSVNSWIKKDWQPLGGITFDKELYIQAMVEYDKK